jgi:hypothetical protein
MENSTICANQSTTNTNNNGSNNSLCFAEQVASVIAGALPTVAAAAMAKQQQQQQKKSTFRAAAMSSVSSSDAMLGSSAGKVSDDNNNNDASGGGEAKMLYGVNVNLTPKQQCLQYGKTVRVFEQTSVDPRLCKFVREGGAVTCGYVQVGSTGSKRFVRHGAQQWCDAAGNMLRQRHWRYGVLHGMEQMWLECHVDATMMMSTPPTINSSSSQSGAIAVSIKMLVESRCWENGKMVGIECIKEAHRVATRQQTKSDSASTPIVLAKNCWSIGPTQRTQEWRDGLKWGTERRTRIKDGREIFVRTWQQGVAIGEERAYYRNGAVHLQGSYCNGRRVGAWQMFDRSGNMVRSTQYKNGMRHGDSVVMKMQKTVYVNGKRATGKMQTCKK